MESATRTEVQEIKDKAVKGIVWTGFSQFGTLMIGFVTLAILARVLQPKDFGIIGTATVFTGLVMMLNEAGLGSAVVQRQNINDDHLSTVFWANLFLGFLSWGLATIASPIVADFFNN